MLLFMQEAVPVYYPSPNISRPVNQLTEEEQIKIAKRLGLIQHLPTGSYDGCKKNREYVLFYYYLNIQNRVLLITVFGIYSTSFIPF